MSIALLQPSFLKAEGRFLKEKRISRKADGAFLKAEGAFLKAEGAFLKAERAFLKAEETCLILDQHIKISTERCRMVLETRYGLSLVFSIHGLISCVRRPTSLSLPSALVRKISSNSHNT